MECNPEGLSVLGYPILSDYEYEHEHEHEHEREHERSLDHKTTRPRDNKTESCGQLPARRDLQLGEWSVVRVVLALN